MPTIAVRAAQGAFGHAEAPVVARRILPGVIATGPWSAITVIARPAGPKQPPPVEARCVDLQEIDPSHCSSQ